MYQKAYLTFVISTFVFKVTDFLMSQAVIHCKSGNIWKNLQDRDVTADH